MLLLFILAHLVPLQALKKKSQVSAKIWSLFVGCVYNYTGMPSSNRYACYSTGLRKDLQLLLKLQGQGKGDLGVASSKPSGKVRDSCGTRWFNPNTMKLRDDGKRNACFECILHKSYYFTDCSSFPEL